MPNYNNHTQEDETKITKISLSLATKEDVLSWSHGEVTKPETINYKSYKPERKGLFDELIFGPTTDYKCPICGRKYKRNAEGQTCSNTPLCEEEKPEILSKLARRSRMGHIALEVPVVHFWFFKIDHSIISKLLGLRIGSSNDVVSKTDLENVIYYKSHIVLDSGGLTKLPTNTIINVNNAAEIYKNALVELRDRMVEDSNLEAIDIIDETIEEVFSNVDSKVSSDYGVDFYELNEVIEEYSDAKIDTGSSAIKYLLANIDLETERDKVRNRISEINASEIDEGKLLASRKQERNILYKRLKIINSFINSEQNPSSMLIYNLPVIPVELRPLVQLDGGRHSTSDINELYRRIIIRNNRLKKWRETEAPTLIVQNELRMLQEAVDALIDNSKKKPKPVVSKDGRNLKSIADALTGKKGRFRQNLLGKRVDYSGRSVIVAGPTLKMHQAGIPREMAAKLFEPWIIKRLIDKEMANSVKSARRLIENLNPIIWPEVAQVIKGRPILLNRAPTLHRLSIQAFEPVLIRGRAIRLHPLVTTAFNADFDGDQMAVHVPISDAAVREAQELLFANRNILGPKDGEPIINPSQDMILGLYYLTVEEAGAKGEGRIFNDLDEIEKAYLKGIVSLHARIAIPTTNLNKWSLLKTVKKEGYIISTVGKFILNEAFPFNFYFIFDNSVATYTDKEYMKKYCVPYGVNIVEHIKNMPLNDALVKKDIAKIIRKIHSLYVPKVSKADIASVIDQITDANYKEVQWMYNKLITYEGNPLSRVHADSLTKFTTQEYEVIAKRLSLKNGVEKPLWEIEQYVELLENVWFNYVNLISSFLDQIKDLGFKYSTISGISISISDIVSKIDKKAYIKQGDEYTNILKDKYAEGFITDDERYLLSIAKWSKIKDDIQTELSKETQTKKFNPLFAMMNSGARATLSNYVQLGGLRGLMANNTKTLKADAENERVVRSTVEIPVKSSFMDGLTSYEFYSSTHGARKGLTDTALNTAKSGYLTRRLVDVAQGIVAREHDCGTDMGFVVANIVDNKTKSVIVTLGERIEGRFSMRDVKAKDGRVIVGANELITEDKVAQILENDIQKVEIRSTLACHTEMGVCQLCYGKDLATSRIVAIGEAVGITASQSIGEPGTQLTMRTFHSGGVAGVEDITGGFSRLTELIDAYHKPWGRPAKISEHNGIIADIKKRKSQKTYSQDVFVVIEYLDELGNSKTKEVQVPENATLRVKKGDQVIRGQKIIDGPIILTELLKVAGTRAVQSYLLKEIQRIYRMQGISISDKYIEIIISRMLSKIQVTIPGDSDLIAGSLVDRIAFQRLSGKLLSQGKIPPYGEVVIRGAKQIPLLSQSFLAAASYQESAKIIVNAAISSRVDSLNGLKENIILGHKIPAGTNFAFEDKSKYDIQDSYQYFAEKRNIENSVDIDPYFDSILQGADFDDL